MEHELELRRIKAEEKKAAMELYRAKPGYESKKGERENRSDAAEEIQRSVRIARSPELPAFLDGRDDLDNYLLLLRDMLQLFVGRRIRGLHS